MFNDKPPIELGLYIGKPITTSDCLKNECFAVFFNLTKIAKLKLIRFMDKKFV